MKELDFIDAVLKTATLYDFDSELESRVFHSELRLNLSKSCIVRRFAKLIFFQFFSSSRLGKETARVIVLGLGLTDSPQYCCVIF